MKAIVYTQYGPPLEVLEFSEVEKPSPQEDEVLIKISAVSVNFGDLALIKGDPFLARLWSGLRAPKYTIPGGDIAGRVEAVGSRVQRFQPGDAVFGDIGGTGFGAFAEYVSAPEHTLALKPANITFEEAAAVPQAAVVALQGLRNKGRIQPGQKVLINGASGGIGPFAVQIAKSYETEVTGVCSTQNLDMVRSIGADHVIDYTQEDFTQNGRRYDLILDIVANRSVSDYVRVLNPNGRYVAIAFNPVALFLGPLISTFGNKNVSSLYHQPNVEDLVFVSGLLEAGKVTPVIDRRFALQDAAVAVRYLEEGHPQGKVVITTASV